MQIPKYKVLTNGTHDTYEFLSHRPKGTIKKVVQYTQIRPRLYNLAFGDWDEVDQEIKDNTRSNNSDRDMILATVASTVIDFLQYHPGSILFAQGQTLSKTRLYQIGINTNWKEISVLFNIFGFCNGVWEKFQLGKNYQAFILRAK
jgi:hypothetical protein